MAKKITTKIEVLGFMTSDTEFTPNEIIIYRGAKKVLWLDNHHRQEYLDLLEYIENNNIIAVNRYVEDYLGIKVENLEIEVKTFYNEPITLYTNMTLAVETMNSSYTLQLTKCKNYEVVVIHVDGYDIAEFDSYTKALEFINSKDMITAITPEDINKEYILEKNN